MGVISQAVKLVDELDLFVRFEGDGSEGCAVFVPDDEGAVFQFQVRFGPLFLQGIETVENLHIAGFFLEIFVGFAADLQTAETFFEVPGAETVDRLIDAFVFGGSLTLHVGGETKEDKSSCQSDKKYLFHQKRSIREILRSIDAFF